MNGRTRTDIVVLIVLIFVAGMLVGAQFTLWFSRTLHSADVTCIVKDVPPVCDTSRADDLRVQLDKANESQQRMSESLKDLVSSETVLYRLETPGLPLLNGAITLSPGSQAHPVGDEQPEWVLPLRIRPTCVRCGSNAEWAWVNKRTHAVEGPYRVTP